MGDTRPPARMTSASRRPQAGSEGTNISQIVALIGSVTVAVEALSPLATQPLLPLSVVWLVLTCVSGVVAFGTTAGIAALSCGQPLRRVLSFLRWLAAG